jgi:PST family polysaccharide transporter
MVGFADIAIRLLYSAKFIGAVAILKWQVLGDFFKIISWPCGFVFLAKGHGKLYMSYSISYTIIYMVIVYFGWDYFGFVGIGLSFFIAQLVSVLFTYIYSYNKFGIHVTKSNLKVITVFILLLTFAFYSEAYLIGNFRLLVSVLALVTSIGYSIYHLNSIMDVKRIINKILKR